MGELEREDIAAALLLSWLKYTAVSKQDVQNMATIFYEKKESKKLQKSRRKISKPIPKKIRISPSTLTNLPSLPPVQNLRGIIGTICSDPFQKQLTKSDVDEHQGRLLLNNEDARSKLLPLLNGKNGENLANGVKVTTFDQLCNSYKMTFKTWGNYRSCAFRKLETVC
nr:uncharacterized protein LOC117281419 [Nicotiana tomentosiformis]